jgi:hypothetical protein
MRARTERAHRVSPETPAQRSFGTGWTPAGETITVDRDALEEPRPEPVLEDAAPIPTLGEIVAKPRGGPVVIEGPGPGWCVQAVGAADDGVCASRSSTRSTGRTGRRSRPRISACSTSSGSSATTGCGRARIRARTVPVRGRGKDHARRRPPRLGRPSPRRPARRRDPGAGRRAGAHRRVLPHVRRLRALRGGLGPAVQRGARALVRDRRAPRRHRRPAGVPVRRVPRGPLHVGRRRHGERAGRRGRHAHHPDPDFETSPTQRYRRAIIAELRRLLEARDAG